MNHLQNEASPYLRQHASNPIDWYPWCSEAFERAEEENKPIFLSIGYATCHWCHVMAHESFEDEEVAQLLNRFYISIKVDRELRPDIDAVYMQVCQMLTGSGGWPLTLLLFPDGRPFFAATYLPRQSQYGMLGLLDLLRTAVRKWRTGRAELDHIGRQLLSALQQQAVASAADAPSFPVLLEQAVVSFRRNYDARYGGFSAAPKFPMPHQLLFLLHASGQENQADCRQMALHTLNQMARGGLFDHVGGGFCRYSTDRAWLVPHFEKMLYDNALLAYCYASAFQLTEEPHHRTICMRTLDYLLHEMQHETGGFFCAQDADCGGAEGRHMVWTPHELEAVLGAHDAALFCRTYDITLNGNWEGHSIPNLIHNEAWRQEFARLRPERDALLAYRRRQHPVERDEKILTAWNGFAIAAFAKVGMVFDRSDYIQAACRAASCIEHSLTSPAGRLLTGWCGGRASQPAQLYDYTAYALSLIRLYEATWELAYLRRAIRLAEQMQELFFDADADGYFLYASDSEPLLSRPKEITDGAIPSGNGMAALLLERLSRLTGEERWREAAQRQLAFVARESSAYPAECTVSLLAIRNHLSGSPDLVCVTAGRRLPEQVRRMLHRYSDINVLVKTAENEAELAELAPFTASYPLPKHGTAYYLCRHGSCEQPVYALNQLELKLQRQS